MRNRPKGKQRSVLVAVIKDWRDLSLLLHEHWYRIPVAHLPKRAFTHIAFYQPAAFGQAGKGINFYARVHEREVRTRLELLPDESNHPRADDSYSKFSFKKIIALKRPIKNVIPRRVSFGFTDLASLKRARDILELYHVPKTEQLMAEALAERGIKTKSELTVVDPKSKRRVRLDLVVECVDGRIAIECDNKKAHMGKAQQERDRVKDALLKRLGWEVVRLKEREVLDEEEVCVVRIQELVQSLGYQMVKQRSLV